MKTLAAGRYVLETPVGRGAAGQVWRARDTHFDRRVAVKIVPLSAYREADLQRDEERFGREIVAVGRLNHPNVAVAHDAGREGDSMFLVTEYVEGRSLAGLLHDRTTQSAGPFPLEAALDLAQQVCSGLAVAHAAGIVHRDLKPANLMLSTTGQVKIIDFGIALIMQGDQQRITTRGSPVGTLAYAAPEQLNDAPIDARTDLYALGCVIYEVLAGVRPFAAERIEVLLHQRMTNATVPLDTLRGDVPAEVAQLVAELMRARPDERPASADTVRRRIRRIREAAPPRARSAPRGTATVSRTPAGPPVPSGVPIGSHERPTVVEDVTAPRPVAVATTPTGSVPARSVPVGSVPPAPPAPRPARRRTPWIIAAAVLAIALVAATAWYVLGRPDPLAVRSALATVSNQQTCDTSLDIVGTIATNGNPGRITYQWIRSGGGPPVSGSTDVARGQHSVTVHLRWAFQGSGRFIGQVTLNVLSPQPASATTQVTFPCG